MSLLFEQFLKGHLLGLLLFERLHSLAVGVSGVRLRQLAVLWIVAAAAKSKHCYKICVKKVYTQFQPNLQLHLPEHLPVEVLLLARLGHRVGQLSRQDQAFSVE